jgi:HSP20 family molecular chaperone IbpA
MLERDSFERWFDELFDEMLLSPWRFRTHVAHATGRALVEYEDRYEVRIATGEADPRNVEVEVSVNRLKVSVATGHRSRLEREFTFNEQLDVPRVTARWWHGVLTVILPKGNEPS